LTAAWEDPALASAPAPVGTPEVLPPLRDDPFAPSEPLDVVPSDVTVPEPPTGPVPQWQPAETPIVPEPRSPAYQVYDSYEVATPEPSMAPAATDWPPVDVTVCDDQTVFEPLVVDVPDLVEEQALLGSLPPDAGAGAGEISWASGAPETAYAPAPAYEAAPENPAHEPAPVREPVVYASLAVSPSPPVDYPQQPVVSVAQPQMAMPGQYQQAGADWHVGGMSASTATGADGGLALRRAEARWALADLVAPGDFTVEAIFDFRSGSGFGVLFRAAVDNAERLTGYSFDVDMIAASGGFLLRQWENGTEHWQPLAQVPAADASRLYGRHTLTLTAVGDRVTVAVDGDTVLDLDGLAPCRGERVGVHAATTTEVTVESFRLAQH
jgi:hypothetical protein